ncbi:hypothetical protein J1N35_040867 [Gossypium stocksii]|uniref:Uncharacterized protein n=1 Tax=Gossypium stocksii TaxID=47602 RepID=A0A9D3UEE2_9ROSI|nr:hypothetical protein J1N35_040867 [Gossypium stocksii]
MISTIKLKPLNGTNYSRWSQRIFILFEQLEVDYVLFNPPVTEEPRNFVTIPRDSNVDATKSDYRNILKHKKRVIPLTELISYMKIGEANHLKDKALIT